MRRVHVTIHGRVHGVFFRAYVRDCATRLGIKGFVRNIPDGVDAVFEGSDENITDILQSCRKGPAGAKVVRLEVKDEKYRGEFKDFRIVYEREEEI